MMDLIDITNEILPDENINFFSDEESLELYQTCIHLMEVFIKENPTLITEPDFHSILEEDIKELMHAHFDNDIFYTEEAQDEMEDIIEKANNDFFKQIMPPRSYPDAIILDEPDKEYVSRQLNFLRNKPQPEQRTKEWYEFRYNLITASNAYKAFENLTTQNQLIYEKCKPFNQGGYINEDENIHSEDIKELVMVNTNTTLHWGQKYEPLSVQFYEYIYNTKIEDFGCIQHETYKFLGASPDGINVDPDSKRYGRMLEIKNIVNREIDGIPKKEYWIQMQLQMEVCDFDECDFLETKFIEYTDYSSYILDTSNEVYVDDDGLEFKNLCLSIDNNFKGQIIHFHTKEGKPFYLYKPLDIMHPNDIKLWEENAIDRYQNDSEFKYTYIKTIYWKLEHVSCVLVCRNRQWFKDNIDTLQQLWSIIENERINGYEHRAPNRKQKKETIVLTTTPSANSGCLLQFNKTTGKISVVKHGSDENK